MNRSGFGFMLLTSHLGNPERKPLTTAQLRTLTQRIRWSSLPMQDDFLKVEHLIHLGYDRGTAFHICSLLDETELLDAYLRHGEKLGCYPVTRQNADYPLILRKRLGLDTPGCLWLKGDKSLLNRPGIALVGSRDLFPANRSFAEEVGKQAAIQGMTLISGNARGADSVGQESCLSAGGKVISVVADSLSSCPERSGVLYVSEEDYDMPFSSFRALRRNRVIHAMGEITLVAQCSLEKGGTWNGTTHNLEAGWSKVLCCRDGSPAALALEQLGAVLVDKVHLTDFTALAEPEPSLF